MSSNYESIQGNIANNKNLHSHKNLRVKMNNKDLYSILQVSFDASSDEINTAFRVLAEKYHPTSSLANSERYREIIEAYEILGNPTKRREYDISRHIAQTTGQIPTFSGYVQQNEQASTDYSYSPANKVTLQAIINMLYEQINFESVNHNPAKSRVYQEIYNGITSNREKIEISGPENNEIWEILKSYKPYLSSDEYNNLMLMIAKMFNISESQASRYLNIVKSEEIPLNKIYILLGLGGILIIAGIIIFLIIFTMGKGENANIPGNLANNAMNVPANEIGQNSVAEIVNIGVPINIRSAPTTQWNNIIGKLDPGVQVQVVKLEQTGWYFIKKDNLEGYIYGGMLKNNNYPDSYPVAEINKEEIKVFDKNHKVFRALKSKDRLVVFYQDQENYYVNSEKGNLIGIKKEDIDLENPQNSNIPYIEDEIKATIKYFAVSSGPMVVETQTPEESEAPVPEETAIPKPPPVVPTQIRPKEIPTMNETKEDTVVPPVIFPGKKPENNYDINLYIDDVKNRIISNWKIPSGSNNYGTIAIFRINKTGYITNVKLQESSGSFEVDKSSLNAIKQSGPFAPLPKNFNHNYVDVIMNFDDKT